jgi:hypothetical protein
LNKNVTVTGLINFLDVTAANGVTMTTPAVARSRSAGTPLIFIVTPFCLTLTQRADLRRASCSSRHSVRRPRRHRASRQ